MLTKYTDDLEGCAPGSYEERELAPIERANAAYEAVRWSLGRAQDGKG